PPPEPPDVKISLIVETDAPVMNNFDKLNEDECFDPGGDEIDVEDNDSFTFVIQTFLPFLTYPEVRILQKSQENGQNRTITDISRRKCQNRTNTDTGKEREYKSRENAIKGTDNQEKDEKQSQNDKTGLGMEKTVKDKAKSKPESQSSQKVNRKVNWSKSKSTQVNPGAKVQEI
ncbi:hypothetical protein Tco_0977107, partial [Tanacetum coccineum]